MFRMFRRMQSTSQPFSRYDVVYNTRNAESRCRYPQPPRKTSYKLNRHTDTGRGNKGKLDRRLPIIRLFIHIPSFVL